STIKLREIERFLVGLAGADRHTLYNSLLACTAHGDFDHPFVFTRIENFEVAFVRQRSRRHRPNLESRDPYIRGVFEHEDGLRSLRHSHGRNTVGHKGDLRFVTLALINSRKASRGTHWMHSIQQSPQLGTIVCEGRIKLLRGVGDSELRAPGPCIDESAGGVYGVLPA